MRTSPLDLPAKARLPFAAAYVVLLALIVTCGQLAPDHVFGFQMFNETSSLKISLYREVRAGGRVRRVRVRDGSWGARDEHGTQHTFRWQDRVPTGSIARLDTFVHASYGLDAQLFHLERALTDLAAHVPLDHETLAFEADVETRRNGRAIELVHFRAVRP